MSHACPAEGCRERVRDDLWACRDHWWGLPNSIRKRLMRDHSLFHPMSLQDARADALRFWRSRAETPRQEAPDARPE